jgi:hypothetical protein
LEAVAAQYWCRTIRLKWHLAVVPAGTADCIEHFAVFTATATLAAKVLLEATAATKAWLSEATALKISSASSLLSSKPSCAFPVGHSALLSE